MEFKREIKEREPLKAFKGEMGFESNGSQEESMPFSNTPSSVEHLESVMKARDELFDVQLNDDLKAHRKLANLMMK